MGLRVEDINKSIADSVKTGQYFVDSKNWYFNKYVYPSVERTFFGVIGGCFLILVIFMAIFTTSTTSEVLESTYTVSMQDTIKQVARFQPLDETIKPSVALNNYMLGYYVQSREAYDFNNLDVQLVKMSNLSTLGVYNDFHNYMSINNVNSPQFTYQKDNTRTITINSINYIAQYQAQISFTASTLWVATNRTETSNWVAQVEFAVSDLEALLNAHSTQLDFVVTSYSVSAAK